MRKVGGGGHILKSLQSEFLCSILGENFLLLEGRKNIFLSASRSQLVITGPANI